MTPLSDISASATPTGSAGNSDADGVPDSDGIGAVIIAVIVAGVLLFFLAVFIVWKKYRYRQTQKGLSGTHVNQNVDHTTNAAYEGGAGMYATPALFTPVASSVRPCSVPSYSTT